MPEDTPTELAYDSRQGYANLVNIHNEKYVFAKFNDNFSEWFKYLKFLKSFTFHNWSNKDVSSKKYNELLEKVRNLSNNTNYIYLNKQTNKEESISLRSRWEGITDNPLATEVLESALMELEEFIQLQLKDGGVYGSKYDDEGL